MEIPRYLQILWSYKWLLVAGLLVAIVAGVFAGFTLQNGQFVSRAKHNYTAATTVMLEGENSTLLQAVIPGEEVDQTTTASIRQDLGSVAVLYAYLAASEEMQARVESVVGDFSDDEQMTAVSRTTQPNGDERFPGRLVLPIIDVVGVSDDAARAELISQAAAEQFGEPRAQGRRLVLELFTVPNGAHVVIPTIHLPAAECRSRTCRNRFPVSPGSA